MKYTVTSTVTLAVDFEFDTDETEEFNPTGAKPDDPDRLDPTDPDTVHDFIVDMLDDEDQFLNVLTESGFSVESVSDVKVEPKKDKK